VDLAWPIRVPLRHVTDGFGVTRRKSARSERAIAWWLRSKLAHVKGVIACAAIVLLSVSPRAQAPTSARVEAGWQALQNGDAETAAAAFHAGLLVSPRDPSLHLGAGAAAHMLGREPEAVQSLKRALELEPRLTSASSLLGEIEHQEGEIDAAIRTYEQALSRSPANPGLRARLDEWRRESAVHDTLEHWNDQRFSLIFDGTVNQALGQRGFDVLGAAYMRIGQAIGAYPSGRITVTLYTEQQFRDITHAPSWSGGQFDGRIRIPVKGAAQNLAEFDRVLAHELTHAMIDGVANRGVPAWLHEGLASYFEPRDAALAARRLKSLGTIVPLANLQGSFESLTAGQAAIAYAESLVAADVLIKRLGADTGTLLGYLGRGQSFDDTLTLFGLAPGEFDSAFRRRFK
jgi:hypothetical protein